jgi:hypothetical protein
MLCMTVPSIIEVVITKADSKADISPDIVFILR